MSTQAHKHNNKESGYMLLMTLLCASLGVLVITALASWVATDIKATQQTIARERAIQIAEAGIDYYRWHLAHAPLDFQDGTGVTAPYVHAFEDRDGNVIGHFILEIIPPPTGSTLVTILSTGSTSPDGVARTIRAQLAKPSIAKYAVAANDTMRFGAGTEVYGPIHSNKGIRFDGIAHNIITSTLSTYDDPDHGGAQEFAVHTHDAPTDPLPPAAVPARPDVFESGRTFPVPSIDFTGMTADLSVMRTDAQTSGFYRGSSGSFGYHVVIKTNDTFDLYRVSQLTNAPGGCDNAQNQAGWGTWSIQNQVLLGNYAFPSNGIMFFEDHVFVDGQIDTGRLTIIAATLPDNPTTRRNIIVNNDLLYTQYDGSDAIGLIGQNNVLVGLVSEDNLRIDGALIAQNGFTGRYYYRPPSGWSQRCSPNHERDELTLWGMIATNLRYGFAYTDGTGYDIRNLNYDGSLLYAPPPSFPLTGDEYVVLSWEEE
jgi:hypothetical protein